MPRSSRPRPTVLFDDVADERFVQELAKRLALPKHLLQQLGDSAYTVAWTIAKTYDVRVLAKLKKLLEQAIREGAALQDWLDENLPQLVGLVGLEMTEAYATTIFRTTLGHVFEAVRFDRLTQDQQVEWLVYDAINDDRVREDHLALDGMAFPRDQFPKNLWPPNGYNCRCTVIPAKQEDLIGLGAWTPRGGLAGLPEPDEGFNAPPSLRGLSDIVQAQLRQAIDAFA